MFNFKPDAVFEGVADISFDYLSQNNIKGILLDIDNTLIDMTKTMPEAIYDWVMQAKARGIKICILSNTNKLDKLNPLSQKLGVPYVSFAKKPAKSRIY
jgi:HAD superfamily phosphatase (TIGR01668 family)